jgi:Ca2+/Na+ antiporter
MSTWLAAVVFVAAAAVSLGASAVLVARLERVCTRLGLSAALLGLIAALAADAPEVTSAVTALTSGQHDVGTGVVLGSNVFNLAALLGLGAIAARGISLHRRVVLLEGSVALWMAAVTIAAVAQVISPVALNSNTLNVVAGLLIPAVLISGADLGGALPIAVWYGALTLVVLAIALAGRGVSRRSGLLIGYAYVIFAVTVVVTAVRSAG